jgi:RNA polymerase sigma factor (sigma-70 family)
VEEDGMVVGAGMMESLSDPRAVDALRTKLLRFAWYRYRVPRDEAEDIVQTTFAAYLQVRGRYDGVADHRAILVGIFRKKCVEYIDRAVREQRRLARYCATPDAARENPWIRPDHAGEAPSVLEDLVSRETRGQILDAIMDLRPSSRALVGLILFERLGRKALIDHLKLNKNTLDSRLHACRTELRRLLAQRHVGPYKSRALAAAAAAPAPSGRIRQFPLESQQPEAESA